MKKLNFTVLLLIFSFFAYSQADILTDDFETYSDFVVDNIGSWTTIDLDEGSTWAIENHSFANEEYIGSYIVFNPASVSPSLAGDPGWQPYSGDKYIACFSAVTDYAPNNDWIISEEFVATQDFTVALWLKSITDQYGLERYNIYLMDGTTENDVVEKLNQGTDYDEAPINWTNLEYEISGYEGQNLRVGIQCVSDNAFALLVDAFSVTDPNSADLEDNKLSKTFIYPNPANDFIKINSRNAKVKITDTKGVVLIETINNEIDLSNLQKGVYFVQIEKNDKVYTEKLILQ